jgi:GMP synthase (glutamine-hydrolysing) A subunit
LIAIVKSLLKAKQVPRYYHNYASFVKLSTSLNYKNHQVSTELLVVCSWLFVVGHNSNNKQQTTNNHPIGITDTISDITDTTSISQLCRDVIPNVSRRAVKSPDDRHSGLWLSILRADCPSHPRNASLFEVLSYRTTAEQLRQLNPKGIILSGGPSSVYDAGAPLSDPEIWDLGIPVLGVCYGMQLMVQQLGGNVVRAKRGEYGKASLVIDDPTDLLTNVEDGSTMWMSHGDSCEALPTGFEILAHTENTPGAAIAHHQRKLYGVQFHPEVIHSVCGLALIRNFVYHICDCEPTWTTAAFVEESIREIGQELGRNEYYWHFQGGLIRLPLPSYSTRQLATSSLVCSSTKAS